MLLNTILALGVMIQLEQIENKIHPYKLLVIRVLMTLIWLAIAVQFLERNEVMDDSDTTAASVESTG